MILEDIIRQLYLEGAAEDMIINRLKQLESPGEEIPDNIIQFFCQKQNGKLVFKESDVPTLYMWLRDQHANQQALAQDYTDYLRLFQNVPLTNFKNYDDWVNKVHRKVDQSNYEKRNKNLKPIEVAGEDKENVIADDENVLILRGDDEHKCVRYGRGYSFCISRGGGGNMYGSYRLSKASTFYFVFFKKVAPEDPKHIMVLDRTKEGWEWTFGDNNTKKVTGGWKVIAKAFPVLAKYEKLFVNKALTSEEKRYQKKLSLFVTDPSLEAFEEFSYKEKADVLKFGSLIPLDLFQSLDSFLRNEWVSVGPKMSNDIYNLLTDKEKERFVYVRKQQLTLRDVQDKWDIEICKQDKELYDKHIKPDKELCEREEREIQKLIVDGVCEGNIKITSKYFFPNLDNLKQVSGNINANTVGINVSLPQLQACGDIYANFAKELNLPQLQKSGTLHFSTTKNIDLPQLQACGNIYAAEASNVTLPQLQTCGDIYASSATSVILPQLQTSNGAGGIHLSSIASVNLPQLKTIKGDIYVRYATSINLPQLQTCGNIDASSATSVILPQLQTCGSIYPHAAEKIVIPSKLIKNLAVRNSYTKIIDPKEYKEEPTQSSQVKAESFKQYFNQSILKERTKVR